MERKRRKSNLTTEGTSVENRTADPSDSPTSSTDGADDPANVPLAQSFPSSGESSEEEELARPNPARPTEKVISRQGLGLFLRGFETIESKARKKRRFGSVEEPAEPAHVRRQKREYYDSDNSYEALDASEYSKVNVETVDYYDVAAGPSCDESIFINFDRDEVSELIGYATDAKREASISAAAKYASLPALMHDKSRAAAPSLAGQSLVSSLTSVTTQSHGVDNPLLGLPSTPLPTSHLRYISKMAAQAPEFSVKLENRFSDSALVATGMLVEEMITASLMPLAGYHVMRCRELEVRREPRATEDSGKAAKIDQKPLVHPVTGRVMQSDKILVNPLEKSSEEWTLPPDEAMMKLLEQDAIPPEGLYLTPPATQTLHDENRKALDKDWEAVQLFSTDNKITPENAIENMDIYRLFLQMANYKRPTEEFSDGSSSDEASD
ncbi:unnamed protein product [Cylindrotheca closterium]|uniref:Uncharacterized protein n=1 Tax=Cylindrotheca closterium TaxID=2856 RepID=A0AAD2GBR6_9STRA|nr:unnamed protein product [Cylindrotheca closterium]